MGHGYPDLHGSFDWPLGVHRAPVGYQHPWLVVTRDGTLGAWSRAKARIGWRGARDGADLEWVEERLEAQW